MATAWDRPVLSPSPWVGLDWSLGWPQTPRDSALLRHPSSWVCHWTGRKCPKCVLQKDTDRAQS